MTKEEFTSLKHGDKVMFVPCEKWGAENYDYHRGEVLIREKSWLDCKDTVKFVNSDGVADYLSHTEVELIQE